MSATFDHAMADLNVEEGGYVNDPRDAGGPTNRGVTQRTYDAWRITHGFTRQDVRQLTDDEERAIYFENYWTPCRCEELPPALAAAVFDMAVNSGVWNAKLALQRAVHVQADGVIGPATIAAASVAGRTATLDFLKQRAGLITEAILDRPSNAAFLHGWIDRLLDQAWKGASNE